MAKKVSIQAGHLTGKDSGAVNGNVQEAVIVDNIVKVACKYLKENYEPIQIFSKNVTKEQAVKEANANNVDLFVEVHINSATNKSAEGFECFIYPNSNSATKNAQKTLHAELWKAMQSVGVTKNRGMKQENFYVLRETKMIAWLPELAFISNEKEKNILTNTSNQNKIAQGIAVGIAKVLGLKVVSKPTTPPKPSTPAPSSNTFYRVVCGSYNDRANADKMVSELRSKGYAPFIDIYKK